MQINVNCVDHSGSFVDGPGIRTLLFLQGCDRHCNDCHNRALWDSSEGTLVDVDDLVKEIKSNCHNKKITITGGEPLLQYDSLLYLVGELEGFDICVYTGYGEEEVPKELIEKIKYLKVGPYDKEKRTTTTPFVGSSNQKFIKLRENDD